MTRRPGGPRWALPVATLLAAMLALVPATAWAAEPEHADVRVREVDGRDVTLDVYPPASFDRTFLPASAFRVSDGQDEVLDLTARRLSGDDLQVVLVVDPLLDQAALDRVADSLVDFIRALPEGSSVGLVVAGEPPRVVPLDRRADAVIDALRDVEHEQQGSMVSAVDRALDELGDRPERPVVVAVNGGHFERPGPATEALAQRIETTPVTVHVIDVRQAAFGIGHVEPPRWIAESFLPQAVERPDDLRPVLDDVRRALANVYELRMRTTVKPAGFIVEIDTGGRQARGATIAHLSSSPKDPLPGEPGRGPVVGLIGAIVLGLVLLGALLFIPRRRRREQLSTAFRPGCGPPTDGTAAAREAEPGRSDLDPVPGLREGPAGPDASATLRAYARAGSRLGGEQVEGGAAVAALLRHGRFVHELVLGPAVPTEQRDELLSLARRRGVQVVRASEEGLREAAVTPDPGVVARAAPLRIDRLELQGRSGLAAGAVVVGMPPDADDEALGAMLRDAERCRLTGVLVHSRPGAVITAEVTRRAAGGVELVDFVLVRRLALAAARLRDAGAVLLGVDGTGGPLDPVSEVLDREPRDRPVAVLLGGRAGLRRQVVRRCHAVAGERGPDGEGTSLLEQWTAVADLLEGRRRDAVAAFGRRLP